MGNGAADSGIRKLLTEEAAPFLGLAVDLVRRFLPTADRRSLLIAAIWLIGQCNVFVRNREQFGAPLVSLALDDSGIEQLTDLLCRWAIGGLAAGSAEPA